MSNAYRPILWWYQRHKSAPSLPLPLSLSFSFFYHIYLDIVLVKEWFQSVRKQILWFLTIILVNMPFGLPPPSRSKNRYYKRKKPALFKEANQRMHNYGMEHMTLCIPVFKLFSPEQWNLHFTSYCMHGNTETSIRKMLYFFRIYVCTFYPIPQLHIQSEHKLACYYCFNTIFTWM